MVSACPVVGILLRFCRVFAVPVFLAVARFVMGFLMVSLYLHRHRKYFLQMLLQMVGDGRGVLLQPSLILGVQAHIDLPILTQVEKWQESRAQ
uniref:Uncharacterized protein n=1 Tax=uncultured prokaryote TaxID=198431 RepID=A0A0H5PZS8_9ZZZZ|nr:hypothetical protein [uncultured prokaryote]